jgi:hypothetical protein
LVTRLDYEPEGPRREVDPAFLALAWAGCCMAGAVGGAVAAALIRWQPEVWNTIGGKALVGGILTVVLGMPVLFRTSLRVSTRVLIGCLASFAVTFLLCHFVFTSW